MDPFKGEVALVREPPGITKPVGALKPAEKTEPIPHTERTALLFHKKEERALHGNVAVS
jgi:hypothetical protein